MRIRIVSGLAAVTLMAACAAKPQTDDPPADEPEVVEPDTPAEQPESAPADAPAADAPASDEPDSSCTTDDDCVVSTMSVSSCCSTCTAQAWNADWFSTFRAQCNEDAAERSCPQIRCAEPTNEIAKCVEGTCEAQEPME